jgi:putative oxidoreductase
MAFSSVTEHFKKPETGLLLLRIGAGGTMIFHGLPKYFGGASVLTSVGKAVTVYGFDQKYALAWGFAAASVEVFGGLLIILGVLFRSSAFALACVLLTALLSLHPAVNLNAFPNYSHAFTMLCIFVSLFLIGPGDYTLGSVGGSGGGRSSGGRKSKGKSED